MESSVFSDRSNNGQNSKSCEPEETQGFEGNFSPNLSLTKNTLCEPQNIIKKQEVGPQNLTSVQSGWGFITNFELLKTHRNAVVSCKDQLKYAITRFGLS